MQFETLCDKKSKIFKIGKLVNLLLLTGFIGNSDLPIIEECSGYSICPDKHQPINLNVTHLVLEQMDVTSKIGILKKRTDFQIYSYMQKRDIYD